MMTDNALNISQANDQRPNNNGQFILTYLPKVRSLASSHVGLNVFTRLVNNVLQTQKEEETIRCLVLLSLVPTRTS